MRQNLMIARRQNGHCSLIARVCVIGEVLAERSIIKRALEDDVSNCKSNR